MFRSSERAKELLVRLAVVAATIEEACAADMLLFMLASSSRATFSSGGPCTALALVWSAATVPVGGVSTLAAAAESWSNKGGEIVRISERGEPALVFIPVPLWLDTVEEYSDGGAEFNDMDPGVAASCRSIALSVVGP